MNTSLPDNFFLIQDILKSGVISHYAEQLENSLYVTKSFGTWFIFSILPHLYKVIRYSFKITMKIIKLFSRQKCDFKDIYFNI